MAYLMFVHVLYSIQNLERAVYDLGLGQLLVIDCQVVDETAITALT
jgi:hypothetical protein